MIDCFDGKIVAYTAGFSPNAELANRMLEKAASTLPGNARPLVHSDRGCHYRCVFLQVGVHSMGTIFRQHRRLVSSGNCAVGTRRPFFLGYLVMRACSLR